MGGVESGGWGREGEGREVEGVHGGAGKGGRGAGAKRSSGEGGFHRTFGFVCVYDSVHVRRVCLCACVLVCVCALEWLSVRVYLYGVNVLVGRGLCILEGCGCYASREFGPVHCRGLSTNSDRHAPPLRQPFV